MSTSNDTSFVSKLTAAIETNQSLLCVGLDPDPFTYPTHFSDTIDTSALVNWGITIIAQTTDLVCCYKPNIAFYEQFGTAGLIALQQTIDAIPDDIPLLLDAKRGDIGSTAAAYARAAFELWGVDAITLSPYLGQDSIAPFLTFPGKMVFILGHTSNPSAAQIQHYQGQDGPLFEHIAQVGQTWGNEHQVGFVVGATHPQALARFREITGQPTRWILAPGIGTQGGDLEVALKAGLDENGSGLIVPVSRSVIYNPDPRATAMALRDKINYVRRQTHLVKHPTPTTTSLHTDLILGLYQAGCIQFGQFTLASGQQSPIYIDLRRITAQPALLQLAAQAYATFLKPLTFHHLAAVPYAALTLGTAVSLISHKPLIYPRKEIKAHGTGKTIEGVFQGRDQVVVIEDLITSGGSVLKAINTLTQANLQVSDVVVLIDREQGGRQTLTEKGYTLHAALTISHILEILYQANHLTAEQVTQVKNYLNKKLS